MVRSRLQRRHLLALAGASVLSLAACTKRIRGKPVPKGAVVLALGDSLTFGMGAAPETSYPAVLARLTGWNVINAGISGHTSAQALERLPGLLEEHSPSLVLVGIGGNDFLRRVAQATTRSNIRSICRTAANAGAQVLLIGVPELGLAAAVAHSLSDHALYAELSQELKVPLHPGGWSSVLGNASLRSDAIHANARGYEQFAQGLAQTVRELGLLA